MCASPASAPTACAPASARFLARPQPRALAARRSRRSGLELDFAAFRAFVRQLAIHLVVLEVLERRNALLEAMRLQEIAKRCATVIEPDLAEALRNHEPDSISRSQRAVSGMRLSMKAASPPNQPAKKKPAWKAGRIE